MQKFKKKHGDKCVKQTSKDYQETKLQNILSLATWSTSDALDRKQKLPCSLLFYPEAIFEMTFNDKE